MNNFMEFNNQFLKYSSKELALINFISKELKRKNPNVVCVWGGKKDPDIFFIKKYGTHTIAKIVLDFAGSGFPAIVPIDEFNKSFGEKDKNPIVLSTYECTFRYNLQDEEDPLIDLCKELVKRTNGFIGHFRVRKDTRKKTEKELTNFCHILNIKRSEDVYEFLKLYTEGVPPYDSSNYPLYNVDVQPERLDLKLADIVYEIQTARLNRKSTKNILENDIKLTKYQDLLDIFFKSKWEGFAVQYYKNDKKEVGFYLLNSLLEVSRYRISSKELENLLLSL
jgi:hypothetical protein